MLERDVERDSLPRMKRDTAVWWWALQLGPRLEGPSASPAELLAAFERASSEVVASPRERRDRLIEAAREKFGAAFAPIWEWADDAEMMSPEVHFLDVVESAGLELWEDCKRGVVQPSYAARLDFTLS